ncbi:MAG: diaminopimelate decarboxylase [Gammaproteobacteria bacterium]|nr:diaminopimelate decarboxylase [Gammaproteobacteria bacterium]MDH5803266.1 diaminopimelate decarboxylase [Gammaproteobacteria bacterium]
MDHFQYKNGVLHAEDVDLNEIARQVGTPCYVYSRATLERHWHAFDDVFKGVDHLLCYAVKANSTLALLNLFARKGSGFDIVSGGELHRVVKAGGDPSKVVFSGVGKSADEMRQALEAGIHCFNVESIPELELLNQVAGGMSKKAPVSLRINPDVDAKTHPYISTGLKENKFGIEFGEAMNAYAQAAKMPHVNVVGVDCHIGSQLSAIAPFVDALKRLLALIDELNQAGIQLQHVDVGGGLGITYKDEIPPQPAEYAQAIRGELQGRGLNIVLEPGRAIVGNAGVLLTQTHYLKMGKHKNFAIVDAAMNDLLRPSLYGAWQDIVPVNPRKGEGSEYDVVGPICETGDFLGKNRQLNLQAGDLLAVRSAGAYGFTMSSNYNTRPRAAEVMVDGASTHIIRERENLDDLLRGEHLLP